MNFSLANKKMQWFSLFFLAFIWGSSFILMKKGLTVFSPIVLSTLRISLAYIALFPFALKHLSLLKSKHLKWFLGTALTGNLLPVFLFAYAQTKLDSGVTGMLNSLVPIFALIISVLFFGDRIGLVKTIGVLIGLAGSVSIIYLSKGGDVMDSNILYSGLVVLATICYALSVNIMKHKLQEVKSMAITSLAFFIIGPFCLIYLLFFTDFIHLLPTPEGLIGLGYIAILSFVGTAGALLLFNELIKHTTSVFATSVTYIIPLVAISWGLFDGEMIDVFQLLLFGVILLGVYITSKG